MRPKLVLFATAALLAARGPARAEPIEPGPEAYEGTAKNVIFFLGDGMGVATVTAARILKGDVEAELTLDRMPFTALSRTYSASHQVADSAAGMVAPMTGFKVANGVISQNESGTPLRTFLEMCEARGKSTGVVTTTSVTHATPASCYAHQASRSEENAIAAQLVPGSPTYNAALGDGLEVILGGGRRYFTPIKWPDGKPRSDEENALGARLDGRDLREEMQAAGYTYVWNTKELTKLDLANTDRLLGLFDSDQMEFEMVRAEDKGSEPSLSEMTAVGIAILQKDEDGFFLMVEGGRIDHGHHVNSAHAALRETLEFDQALATALEMVDLTETLIIVTADHSHVLTISGYPKRGTSIFGIAGTDAAGVPYTTLSYANGPGYRGPGPRVPPDKDEFAGALGSPPPGNPEHPTYSHEAGVPMLSETHAGEDVIVWAAGRRAGQVRGVVENTQIFTWLRTAAGL